MAVIQKFFDQAISSNTSYNPQHYPGSEIPASILIGDLIKSYQMGLKTLYYQNTYDGKGEEDAEKSLPPEALELLALEEEDECSSCKI